VPGVVEKTGASERAQLKSHEGSRCKWVRADLDRTCQLGAGDSFLDFSTWIGSYVQFATKRIRCSGVTHCHSVRTAFGIADGVDGCLGQSDSRLQVSHDHQKPAAWRSFRSFAPSTCSWFTAGTKKLGETNTTVPRNIGGAMPRIVRGS
jgi:hypothetical protein